MTANIAPSIFRDRFFAVAAASLYRDAIGSRSSKLYTGDLFYNLNDDGTSSISAEYLYGSDREKLEHEEKVNVGLNVKY